MPYPTEGASNRVRVEAYIPFLEKDGIKCALRPFITPFFYSILYKKEYLVLKVMLFLFCTINRFFDIFRSFFYDIVFVHREAYPFGPCFFEKIFSLAGKPIIFDFDDAIYLSSTSDSNTYLGRLKQPGKVKEIIKASKAVIAGNTFLADYAKQFNDKVFVIPSCVNTDIYKPDYSRQAGKKITIGWLGSGTTEKFLATLKNVFIALNKSFPGRLEYCFVGGKFISDEVLNTVNIEWNLESERRSIANFDIGIMPMHEDEWTKGKCGYKAIVYMGMGIPVVVSNVGVNPEIVKDGINGFTAGSDEEWVNKLSMLVNDGGLRKKFSVNGRDTVEKYYSIKANYPKLKEVLVNAYGNN